MAIYLQVLTLQFLESSIDIASYSVLFETCSLVELFESVYVQSYASL